MSLSRPALLALCCSAMVAGCGDDESTPPDPPIVLEPDPTLEEVDLGSGAVGDAFVFDVPADAHGAMVVARADGELGFETLSSDDGRMVIDSFGFDGVERYTSNAPLLTPATTYLAVGLPQTDSALDVDSVAGSWTLLLGPATGDAPSSVAMSLWLRRVDASVTGQIDVNLFMAEGVASAEHMDQVMAAAYADFAGLRLGEVTRYPLDASAALVDDDDEYLALLEHTVVAINAPAVNVIAVKDMSGVFGSPGGRAGGIPGLTIAHGTELSGLMMEATGDVALDAHVLRHETGHLAGLHHTSDTVGFDGLADTPQCADVVSDPASCPDADNTMFPQPVVAGDRLSPAQRRVVLGSCLYRADM